MPGAEMTLNKQWLDAQYWGDAEGSLGQVEPLKVQTCFHKYPDPGCLLVGWAWPAASGAGKLGFRACQVVSRCLGFLLRTMGRISMPVPRVVVWVQWTDGSAPHTWSVGWKLLFPLFVLRDG